MKWEPDKVAVRVLGLNDPNPPYRLDLVESKAVIFKNEKNWEEYLIGDKEYDDRFIYTMCVSGKATFYDRKMRTEYPQYNHDTL